MLIVNEWNASYSCLYSFIVDFHLLKVKLTMERMHPYNVWIISNVSLLKVKLIRQTIEIFEEIIIVNGCDASYCCLYSFIVDFHPLTVYCRSFIKKNSNMFYSIHGLWMKLWMMMDGSDYIHQGRPLPDLVWSG